MDQKSAANDNTRPPPLRLRVPVIAAIGGGGVLTMYDGPLERVSVTIEARHGLQEP